MVITWPASRHSIPTTESRPTCMRGWLTTWKPGSRLETSHRAPGCPVNVTWPLNTRTRSGPPVGQTEVVPGQVEVRRAVADDVGGILRLDQFATHGDHGLAELLRRWGGLGEGLVHID